MEEAGWAEAPPITFSSLLLTLICSLEVNFNPFGRQEGQQMKLSVNPDQLWPAPVARGNTSGARPG